MFSLFLFVMALVALLLILPDCSLAAGESCFRNITKGVSGESRACPAYEEFCGTDDICHVSSCNNFYKLRIPHYVAGSSEELICQPSSSSEDGTTEGAVYYKCSKLQYVELHTTHECRAKPNPDTIFICHEFGDDTDFSVFEEEVRQLRCKDPDDVPFVVYHNLYNLYPTQWTQSEEWDSFGYGLMKEPPFNATFAKTFSRFSTLDDDLTISPNTMFPSTVPPSIRVSSSSSPSLSPGYLAASIFVLVMNFVIK